MPRHPLYRLAQATTTRHVVRALLATFAIGALLALVAVPVLERHSGGVPILDQQFGYTVAEAYGALHAYGPTGRRIYLGILAADLIFVLAYAGFFTLTLAYAFARLFGPRHPVQWATLLPIVLAVLDYAENAGEAWLTWHFPERWPAVARATSAANQAKWALVVISVFLAGAGVLTLMEKRRREGG